MNEERSSKKEGERKKDGEREREKRKECIVIFFEIRVKRGETGGGDEIFKRKTISTKGGGLVSYGR